jgi:UDP-N-acetylglucosamine--N-acetylmuramyl-(pentapeptide) pyrophosphoryl-undecaprenol N-acetylglucosamine transferase
VEAAGAGLVILERDLAGPSLGESIAGLLADRSRLARMAAASRALGRPDAGERIAAACLALVER